MNSTDNKLTPPALEARITAALEHKREHAIPSGFAAMVAGRAATVPLRRRRSVPRFGSTIALLSVPVAIWALFAIAPHAAPNLHSLRFDAELVLLGELAFIAVWISTVQARLSR